MPFLRPSKAKVAEKLDQLAESRAKLAALQTMTQQELARHPRLLQLQEMEVTEALNAARLADEIKDAVLHHGETIRGRELQAVWAKGRVSWNTQALIGYAIAHPEMYTFQTVGEPTVAIRKV